MNRYLAILIIIFQYCNARAQTPDDNTFVLDQLEDQDISSRQINEISNTSARIQINRAGPDELRHILSPDEIRAVQEHLKEFGPLTHALEIQAVHGITEKRARQIYHLITVVPDDLSKSSPMEVVFNTRSTKNYNGKWSAKARLNSGKFTLSERKGITTSFFIVAQQDAGEKWLWNKSQAGWDFVSMGCDIRFRHINASIQTGDFFVSSKLGLTIGQGFSFGRSIDPKLMVAPRKIFRPHRSVSENGFMRGIAITKDIGKYRFMAFISDKKSNAVLHNSEQATLFFRALSEAPNTARTRKTVRFRSAGTRVEYATGIFSAGITAFYYRSNHPWLSAYPSGTLNLSDQANGFNMGCDISASLGKFFLIGEGTLQKGQNRSLIPAFVLGAILKDGKQIEYSVFARSYPSGFNGRNSNSLSSASFPGNELGVLTTLSYQPSRWHSYQWLTDISRELVSRSGDGPGRSVEHKLLIKDKWPAQTNSEILIHLRSGSDLSDNRLRARGTVIHQVSDQLRMKIRSDLRWAPGNAQATYSLMQYIDISWQVRRSIRLSARFLDLSMGKNGMPAYSMENDVRYDRRISGFYQPTYRFYQISAFRISQFTLQYKLGISAVRQDDGFLLQSQDRYSWDLNLLARYTLKQPGIRRNGANS